MPYFAALGPFVKFDDEFTPISYSGKDHLTIAFRETIFNSIEELAEISKFVRVTIIGNAMFGEHNDTPVFLVAFSDSRDKHLIETFREKHQQAREGEFQPAFYRPHITKKHVDLQLQVGDELLAKRVFIQEAGEHKQSTPLWETPLLSF